jgi:predicted amidohydrolase
MHATIDDYREDLRRFLRIAQTKHAHLVIFPELAGVMVTPPMLRDFRTTLLKVADRGRRKQASHWHRVVGTVAHYAASTVGADFRASLRSFLNVTPQHAWDAYANLFADLAREFSMIIVAPSAYLPDPTDQVVRNLAGVFARDGTLLGYQAKVVLHPEDEDLAQPGDGWKPIVTEVGALGVMVGGDVLYPEVGRALAYQGAEILVTLAGCPNPVLYQKIRSGMLARMQDNQLFGLVSFLVGHNELSRGAREPFIGKSAIFAPQELTPRLNGVLVEMGNLRSEGVLTADWDFVALKKLWDSSDTPVRHKLPLAQAGQLLARLYERLKGLPKIFDPALLTTTANDDDEITENLLANNNTPLSLDELPIINLVTRRWSTTNPNDIFESEELDFTQLPDYARLDPEFFRTTQSTVAEVRGLAKTSDEETDEMDALDSSEEYKN